MPMSANSPAPACVAHCTIKRSRLTCTVLLIRIGHLLTRPVPFYRLTRVSLVYSNSAQEGTRCYCISLIPVDNANYRQHTVMQDISR